jgi:arylsulfatase
MRSSVFEFIQRLRRRTLVSSSIAAAGMGAFIAAPAQGAQPEPAASEATPDGHGKSGSGARTPNILYIVADDLGYSDLGAFGGEIATPNLDALVQDGITLTNFHTSTVSAVTRSMLYSGTDHHLVGEGTMGAPNDERRGLPGYEGYLNDRALCVADLLKDGGYHTSIAGKWHLGSTLKVQTPDAWGFVRSYALLGGATSNHFGVWGAYSADGASVPQGGNAYDQDVFTDKIIGWIDEARAQGKPFAAFTTYTTPHWPLQVPEPYLSMYAGKYDEGYDVIRARRLFNMKAAGIIPTWFAENPGMPDATSSSAATPSNGKPACSVTTPYATCPCPVTDPPTKCAAGAYYVSATNGPPFYTDYGPGLVNKKWDSMTANERKLYARYMEIYAGMVSNLDHNVGRLIAHLKEIGEYDNTLIVFHSDNGAEGWPLSAAQDRGNSDNDTFGANFANLGKSGSNVQYGQRWAEVSATPFKLYKGHEAEGGISVAGIVRLPGQEKPGSILGTFAHITDMAPTLLDFAGIPQPSTPADGHPGKVTYKDRAVYPMTGVSLRKELEGRGNGPVHKDPVGDEQYGRAFLRDGPWKILWIEPPIGPLDGHWMLFHMEQDRGETTDVSAANPEVVDRMVRDWNAYMTRVGGVEPLRPRGYY